MIVRNCSGGIVFVEDKVLLVCNDKHEWSFPKGIYKANNELSLPEFAKQRIKIETDVDARVLAPCGKTNYEFYSVSRRIWSFSTRMRMAEMGDSKESMIFSEMGSSKVRWMVRRRFRAP